MTDEKRQEQLKKRREAYQKQKEKIAEHNAQMTDEKKTGKTQKAP